MRYEKPEISNFGPAIAAVQNLLGKTSPHPDCAETPSASACESDE